MWLSVTLCCDSEPRSHSYITAFCNEEGMHFAWKGALRAKQRGSGGGNMLWVDWCTQALQLRRLLGNRARARPEPPKVPG